MLDLSALNEMVLKKCEAAPNGCLVFKGATRSQYGIVRVNGRQVGAHRVVLAHKLDMPQLLEKVEHGQPPGAPIYAIHSCDNRPCCNPEHLRLGSTWDNVADMMERGRGAKPKAKKSDKVDPAAIREIRELGNTWDGMCDMMKKHRISQCTVKSIAGGHSHKWVL